MEHPVLNIHAELIDRCRAGDQEAHYELYRLYAKAMYNAALRIAGNTDDAEDVLQEAFISAFRNLDNYRADASFGAWLKRIVVNKAITALQKRKHEAWPESDDWDVAAPEMPDLEDELTVDRVRKAIARLPDGYRTVLSLYLIEGYDHEEIAGIIGISISTSKSQLNRAKNKLREILKESV
ncbi:MAG TPA: sigma-70 family RNA polymerase sigma factor [Ohtaekwangia sp.]|nr:sigma-70 family RNA polymerase sigma factor [Ohtaekwangia sp.]